MSTSSIDLDFSKPIFPIFNTKRNQSSLEKQLIQRRGWESTRGTFKYFVVTSKEVLKECKGMSK